MTPRHLRWYFALAAAALGGYSLDLATPQVAIWPFALLGAALFFAAVWQQPAWRALVYGAVAGACFWLPHLSWLTLYLGPVPWLGLGILMSVWFALSGVVIAVTTRGLAALIHHRIALVIAQSFAAAGIWVVREQLQGAVPYGGFPWGRLAHTQVEGPLAPLVSWLGFTGLSAVLALLCALVVAAIFATVTFNLRLYVGTIAAVVVTFLALSLVPPATLTHSGTLRIAAVQGNSKSGIFDDRENGDVFRAHVDATEDLLDELEARNESVDVIVWPENSAEFAFPSEPARVATVQRLSRRAGAPIAIGTILRDADGRYTNSTLIYDEDGYTGERYDKRRPVPFAEYMPDREFFHALAPDLVDLVRLDYSAGTLPSVLRIATDSGPVSAGIAICFDIIFDDHVEAMSNADAEVIFAQSNNADFGRTDESAQQLAIARLRAIESGHAVVNISTVGTSAIIAPTGEDLDRLPTHIADALIAEVPLTSGRTPALQFGGWIAGGWIVIGAAGFAAAMVGAMRTLDRRGAQPARRK